MCTKAAYSRIHTAFLDLADGPLHLFPVRPPEGIMSYCQILLEKIGTAPLRATAVPLHISGDTAPKAACCLRQREWHLTCIWVSKEYTGTVCFWRLYIMISTPSTAGNGPLGAALLIGIRQIRVDAYWVVVLLEYLLIVKATIALKRYSSFVSQAYCKGRWKIIGFSFSACSTAGKKSHWTWNAMLIKKINKFTGCAMKINSCLLFSVQRWLLMATVKCNTEWNELFQKLTEWNVSGNWPNWKCKAPHIKDQACYPNCPNTAAPIALTLLLLDQPC